MVEPFLTENVKKVENLLGKETLPAITELDLCLPEGSNLSS